MEGLVRRGLHTGGRCYGYRREKTGEGYRVRLVVDESEASVVQRIFNLFASGYSLERVARTLKEYIHRHRSLGAFNAHGRQVLSARFY